MPSFLHTCYRIGEIDRSVAFYGKLGFGEVERVPIDDEAISIFMHLPGEEPRLELTYRHGVRSYDLGDGYSHIALAVEDLDATLERLAAHGIHPEGPPHRPSGSEGALACFVRDPDGYRIALIGAGSGDPGPAVAHSKTEQTVKIDPSENLILPSDEAGGEEVLRALWNDERFARIVNTGEKPLLLRLPYAADNRVWLRGDNQRNPKWNKKAKRWQLPLSWHEALIRKAVDRYGEVIVIMHSRKTVLKCAPACWKAKSSVTQCRCSCGGALHGAGGNPGGFLEINEALAVKSEGGEQVVVTLVTKSGSRASRLRATWKPDSP